MIANATEYSAAQEELRQMVDRLAQLQASHPAGSKDFTKASVGKMIARLHEELAVCEGRE